MKQSRLYKQSQPKLLKKCIKRSIRPQIGNGSMTQTLFPSKKSSLRIIHDDKNQSTTEFYQTLGNTISTQWMRPQSKRASRKMTNRPETSKGNRIFGTQKYFPNNNKSTEQKLRSILPSKSMHNPQKQKILNPSIDYSFLDVEIIVNKKKPEKRQNSLHEQKFRTELPEDFLALFAS